MNNIKSFLFHDAASVSEISGVLESNNSASQLVLEVGCSGTVMIKVQGISDPHNENEWRDMAVINTANYSVANSISAPGIYIVGVDGIRKIRTQLVSVTGEARVFGTLGN